jgi:hypothetical protein
LTLGIQVVGDSQELGDRQFGFGMKFRRRTCTNSR